MEDNENPYSILGVPIDATPVEIKKAYRKLALLHHPDRQSSDEGRQQSTVLFAKISNAYEILGDPTQRANYDHEARYGGQSSSAGGVNANRPWSKMPRRGSTSNRNNNGQQQHFQEEDFFHHTQFHDPFRVFESFFRNEGFGDDFFGHHRRNMNNHNNNNNNNMRGGGRRAVNDPFFGGGGSMFQDPFFGGSGMGMGGSMFGNDPFFGGGGMIGRGGGGDIFSTMMNQQMNGMMNMQQLQQQHFNGRAPQQSFVYSSSSSSNLMGGGGNGESVSTSTTTRIVNGKRQVVTERIVRKADGTVERQVQQSGDDDFPGQQPQQLQDRRRQPALPLQAASRRQPSGSNRGSINGSNHSSVHNDSSHSSNSKSKKTKRPTQIFKRKRRSSSKTATDE